MKRKYRANYGRLIGNMKVVDIRNMDIQDVINTMQREGRATSSMRDALGRVRECLECAKNNRIISENPCFNITVPWENVSKERRFLSQDEQNRFLRQVEANWYKEMFYIMFLTGMRIGEVGGLKWEDVDFAQKTVIVKHTVGRIYNCELKSTERVHSSPKTKNSYREIPISKQLLQALKMVRKQSQSPYVVGTSIQSKEPRSYRDYFGRLLKRLDIPHLVFHGLRHTFATRCIESQCDYKTVSVILGHSNVATTLNLYVHPNLNQKKRCIDRMSNFLGIT